MENTESMEELLREVLSQNKELLNYQENLLEALEKKYRAISDVIMLPLKERFMLV